MKPTFVSILIVFLLASLAAPATAAPVAQYITPSFTIVNVVPGQSITLQTTALSANDTITVTMGNYGTQGVGGAVVGTINSGMGGQVTGTYTIPASLHDAYQIDIRLQSTGSGLYSTNWCYNNSGSPYVPPPYNPPYNPPHPPYPPYFPTPSYPYPPGTTPTITITNVVPDTSVTIRTYNFPVGKTFNVRMGPMGTNGVGGTLAGSFYSDNGGSMTATFSIPANLRGSYQIAIRAESTTGNYYAYDWFTNSGGYNPPYPPNPYPYPFSFTVLSVIRDQSVTIQTNNLAPNQTFNVRMGTAGSQAINGTFVDTVTSSSGGTLVLNFYIPTNLRGMYQIDLRLESTTSGASAYNTFYNNSIGPTPVPYEPSFSVISVIRDQSVTIQTYNFPSATTYNASMGYPGTYYQSGTPAGTLNSGIGGSFTTTLNIPYSLRGANQLNIWLVNASTGQVLSGNFNNYTNNTYSSNDYNANYYTNPSFSIVNIAANSTVTILTSNFPANDTFNVRMGPMGSQGVGGTLVGSINSGAGGSFTATFNIPSNLYSSPQIAIRMESPYSGYYAYNWFYNSSPMPGPIPPGPIPGPTYVPPYPPYPPYPYYPTFNIQSVVRDSTVTIQTNNFPPNDTFTCRMGAMGTQGISGIPCGTINSSSGGSFIATFNIPPSLYGSSQIAIRLESPSSGYYAYNWFYNNSTGPWTPGPYPTPYYGYPTFSIQSVAQNSTVTILTNNFPPNDTFNCKMGPMGTAGIGGTSCGSLSSSSGGSLTATFNIPANLYGSAQIAIRLESQSSGYYAYNWFYNNSTGPWTPGPFPTLGPWTPMPTPFYGYPTFSIQSVVQNQTVTILTSNFPVNDTFDVYMGPMGSQGISGTKVATFNSNGGGSFSATFNIPSNLINNNQIAIRMQSPYSGYYAYNWFYNSTSP